MQYERWRILCQWAAKEQDLGLLLQLVREMNRLLIKRLLQAGVSIAAAGRNLRGGLQGVSTSRRVFEARL